MPVPSRFPFMTRNSDLSIHSLTARSVAATKVQRWRREGNAETKITGLLKMAGAAVVVTLAPYLSRGRGGA